MEAKPKKRGRAVPVVSQSPSHAYLCPTVNKVATAMSADDPAYSPAPATGGRVAVRAKLNSHLNLCHRGTAQVDCGFSLRVPAGFRAVVTSLPEMAGRGLVVTAYSHEGDRILATVMNIGKEIIPIRDRQEFALLGVEPVYEMDWSVL